MKCKLLKRSLTIVCLHLLAALHVFLPPGSHHPRNEAQWRVSTSDHKNRNRGWASKFMRMDQSIKCNGWNHSSSPENGFLFLKGLSTYFSARWSVPKRNIYIELSGGEQFRYSFNSVLRRPAIQQGISTGGCPTTNKIIVFSRARFELE